jgi:3-hydroxybutyryl-CoA dehydratase
MIAPEADGPDSVQIVNEDRLRVGATATYSKTVTEEDVERFAAVTGDVNPVHLDEAFAQTTRFGKRIAHGMLTAGLISTVLGTRLPGLGAIYVSQSLRFLRPVFIGDTVTAIATIESYDRDRGRMKVATVCVNQGGQEVVTGEADLLYQPPNGHGQS